MHQPLPTEDDDEMYNNQGTIVAPQKFGAYTPAVIQSSYFSNCLFQCFAPVFSVFKTEAIISAPSEQKGLLVNSRNRMGYESEEEDEFAATLYGEQPTYANEVYGMTFSDDVRSIRGANKDEFTSFKGGLESILTPDEMREWSSYRDSSFKNLEVNDAHQGREVSESASDKAPTPRLSTIEPDNQHLESTTTTSESESPEQTIVPTSEPTIEESNVEKTIVEVDETMDNIKFEEFTTADDTVQEGLVNTAPYYESEEDEDDDPINKIMANTVTDSDFEIEYQ